jgi:mono/diheme cytochrome c family protein
MITPAQNDPRIDQAAVTDESLLAVHEKFIGKHPDEKARYKLGPLNLLFIFSGLIFFAGTYLNRYAGVFDPHVYNENTPHGAPGKGGAPVAAAPVDPVALGKATYGAVCQACHQVNGQGLPGTFPPLAESEWVVGSEERVIRIALYGLQGPIKVKGTDFPGTVPMPATGRVTGSGFNLADDRIAAVLTYIRQEWGNKAGPISAEKVTEIRTKEGNRGAWTAPELEKLP